MYLKCFLKFPKVKIKSSYFLKNPANLTTKREFSNTTRHFSRFNVLFFGTDEFALESLKALHINSKEKKVLNNLEIVTAYLGKDNNVINYAKEHNIFIHTWPPNIKKNEFDIGIVVSFGHLIPSKIISLFPLGIINVHGSLLPKWRGAAPLCHALIKGETRTGVTIMKIKAKHFDIGDIIAQKDIEIGAHEIYPELYTRVAKLGAHLLNEVVNMLPLILNNAIPQKNENASYAPKITQKDSFIKWEKMTATDVYNLQRGLFSIEPLRAYFNGLVVKLLKVNIVPKIQKCSSFQNEPGLVIYDKQEQKLFVQCHKDTWISVETIIVPGKKPLSAIDFGSGFILNKKIKMCKFY